MARDKEKKKSSVRSNTRTDNYDILADYYDIFIDWENRLGREIPFICQIAGRKISSPRALDIGCGTGYHLRSLRKEGFETFGLEPSPQLRALAVRNLPGATIFSSRMEELECLTAAHGPWHLVICLGNTLAHLPEEKLAGFCRALYRALTVPGTAVIHVLNYEKILANRPQGLQSKLVESGNESYRFERRYDYFQGWIEFTIEIWKNEAFLAKDREILYPLTAKIIEQACSGAGFNDIQLFGDFDSGKPYTRESDNLVAVLRKKDISLSKNEFV